jgi:S-adenosylmethionine/arginine decarboxylase-like enzyme
MVSIHTWPEHKYAAVDIFSCGDKVDYNKIIDYLKDKLKCKNFSSISINRGSHE